MADQDTNSGLPAVIEHLRAALGHALDAVRCLASVLTADAERRAHHVVEAAAWMLAWIALGVVGVVFIAAGLSEFVESAIGTHTPGVARVVTGVLLLGAFLIVLLVRRLRKGHV